MKKTAGVKWEIEDATYIHMLVPCNASHITVHTPSQSDNLEAHTVVHERESIVQH